MRNNTMASIAISILLMACMLQCLEAQAQTGATPVFEFKSDVDFGKGPKECTRAELDYEDKMAAEAARYCTRRSFCGAQVECNDGCPPPPPRLCTNSPLVWDDPIFRNTLGKSIDAEYRAVAGAGEVKNDAKADLMRNLIITKQGDFPCPGCPA